MSQGRPGLPIVLVGPRGAGKTTVGARLATRLRLPFFDLDHELARSWAIELGLVGEAPRAGELLARFGLAAFRTREAQALERLLTPGARIVAVGAGCVETPACRAAIRARAVGLWLGAPLDVLRRRIAADPEPRPALEGSDALEELARISSRRVPLYASVAHVRLAAGRDDPDRIAARAIAALRGATHGPGRARSS